MVETMAWLLGSPFALQQPRLGCLQLFVSAMIFFFFVAAKCLFPPIMALGWVAFMIGVVACVSVAIGPSVQRDLRSYGAYRQVHSRIQEYCESIVFYGGTAREATLASERLQASTDARMGTVWMSCISVACTVFFVVFTSVVCFVILCIQHFYISAFPFDMCLSVIQFYSGMYVGAWQQLPTQLQGVAALRGFLHRIQGLQKKIDALQGYADTVEERTVSGESLCLNAVSLATPCVDKSRTARLIVKELSLKVALGAPEEQSIAIMGPSGCGKSSLLRMIGGLWAAHAGSITRPTLVGTGGIFFVPQNSYTTEGNLRDQITYPDVADIGSGTETDHDLNLLKILSEVGLSHLSKCHGLDVCLPWADVLSGGEQQRLGFARLFYHKPAFAIMDEATSALDVDLEKRCLQRCLDLGITMVSVLHRPTAMAFHKRVLRLDGTGGWSLEEGQADT